MRKLLYALLPLLFVTACVIPVNAPYPNPTSTPPAPSSGPASCSITQEWCQGSCVDTITFTTDSDNCGHCGNRCTFGESCTGGFCSCSAGSEKCMGQCKSFGEFMSDSQNCGRCGNICFAGEQCIGGSCRKI